MLFGVLHPSLHTPLMSVTNAISSVIIVGAIIAGLSGNSDRIFEHLKYFWFFSNNISGNKYFWRIPCNTKNVSDV